MFLPASPRNRRELYIQMPVGTYGPLPILEADPGGPARIKLTSPEIKPVSSVTGELRYCYMCALDRK